MGEYLSVEWEQFGSNYAVAKIVLQKGLLIGNDAVLDCVKGNFLLEVEYFFRCNWNALYKTEFELEQKYFPNKR